MKLSAAERRALPDSAFALPEYRMFPIHDEGHVKAGAARIAQALHEGRITPREYARAESRVLAAERHFGMHSTVYPELTAALESDDLSDTTKAVAVGGALAGAAALAWWLWSKDGFGAKKAAGAAGRGSPSTQGLHGEGLHGAAQLSQLSPSEQAHNDFQAGNSAGQHAGTVVNFHIQALKPELSGPHAISTHHEMENIYSQAANPPAGHPQAWKNGYVAGFKLTAQEPPLVFAPVFSQPHAATGARFSPMPGGGAPKPPQHTMPTGLTGVAAANWQASHLEGFAAGLAACDQNRAQGHMTSFNQSFPPNAGVPQTPDHNAYRAGWLDGWNECAAQPFFR